ncbi:sensor histidine kinase [Dactylosporangium aurantiacum]|uniref:histidine kinase n=1 Tax=Dactylosporangium aurantiacum TaxID=35754 RepID=A0A9Q9IIQ8_9ACTN|nr:sensor histidine kinase [Dactylosporangium aurantiacum]MDG6104091.1 sensor histidine kinase [Dactylosporangium aurantiacum]UWZ56894.1 sensor histidine kinase [Dactylosporangium aurantiacum]
MRMRLTTLAGGLFALLALAATGTSIGLEVAIGAQRRATDGIEAGWISGVAGLALAVPGALLARKVPRNAVAWILCVTGLHWSADGTCAAWVAYATAHDPWLPGVSITWWLYQRLGAALLFSLPLLLIFYPDGRPPAGRGWRWASYVSLGCTAILPVTLLFVPTRIAGAADTEAEPTQLRQLSVDLLTLPLPDTVWEALLRVGYAALPLSMLVPFAVVFRRYRHATGLDKTRMRWLVWAGVVDVLVMLSALLLPQSALSAGLFVAITVTGAAIAIGILRPRLVDIDRLLGGTVLYGALATLVVAVDAVLLAAATTLLGEQGAALAGLLVVMLVYGPLRHRLWQLVQRMVLGRRHDPYRVVSGLAEQLERTDSPEDQLLAVARSVAEAFNAPYVAVEVHRGGDSTLLAEHGHPVSDTQTLPITYRGETVGRLILPAGGPRTVLSPRDERLLADVVRQAAAAARSSHLAAELQQSRERLVGAREEERRRVRRDLHDGLGPALGGVALRIDTARNLLKSSPARADEVLRQAREDVSTALADVRRLVHDLRPPALDDVGLIGAVDQVADRLRTPALTIRVTGEPPAGLAAAVEVAAYRIASEALTNVSKHARAGSCTVDFSLDGDSLVVSVVDDGGGIAAGTPSGVGLISLRERAAELGGRCEISCPPDGGTTVRATLPLGSAARALQEVPDGR